MAGADRNESARVGLAVALETAHRLKVQAVATGVGAKDEWSLLHAWGCNYGQGPFIAAAMEGPAVTHWLDRWHSRHRMSA